MADEFIDDIIASNNGKEESESVENTLDDVNDSTKTKEVISDANKDENSSSTSNTVEHKNVAAVLGSQDNTASAESLAGVEELASQLGWNKKHKSADAVDAATYILRSKDIQKTMRGHNKDLKNQLTGLQGSVDALKAHNERVYQVDVRKLQGELAKLKADKNAAIELADVIKVNEIDQQIDEVKKDIETPENQSDKVINPLFDTWVEDNSWYLTDPDMATYADTIADQYPGAPPERIYALVRTKVAEVFPDKFVKESAVDQLNVANDSDKKVIGPKSPVEAGSHTVASTTFTKDDLSSEQIAIMNQFVNGNIMTADQYISDIAKMQGAGS